MKRRCEAAPSVRKSPRLSGGKAQSLDARKRDPLPSALPDASSSGRRVRSATNKDSAVSFSDRANPTRQARDRAKITPGQRFQPFLDVVTRRAKTEAASVVDPSIARDAVYQHPARSDLLLVTPPCHPCIKQGGVCDRAGWKCSRCAADDNKCSRPDYWEFFDAQTGQHMSGTQPTHEKRTEAAEVKEDSRMQNVSAEPSSEAVNSEGRHEETPLHHISPDGIPSKDLVPVDTGHAGLTQEGVQTDSNGQSLVRRPCLLWASSIDDMRQCDPHFPSEGAGVGFSRSGTVAALLLERGKIQNSLQPSCIEATLCAFTQNFRRHRSSLLDDTTFESLQMASTACVPLRIYYLFDGPGRPYRVANDSIATPKVMLWRIGFIRSAERQDDGTVRLRLSWNTDSSSPDEPGASSPVAALSFSDAGAPTRFEQTFLGYRCNVCGKANRKLSWDLALCSHCFTSFALSEMAADKFLSRRRKMELSFTGPRCDLGQANMLLTKEDVMARSVLTLNDGTRVCTYHLAAPPARHRSAAEAQPSFNGPALHHMLNPGRCGETSVDALAPPSTPFERLSVKMEAELRNKGFALSFGASSQAICARVAAEQHPLTAASDEAVRHIASLRHALQVADAAMDADDPPKQPKGCLFLLLHDSRMRINASFFPASSTHFGILCLTDSTTVALRRDRRAEYTGSHIDRFQKEVSLGTFIMQPHDVVVGKLELLEAVELELTSHGISLWAIAHFSAADTTWCNHRSPLNGDHLAGEEGAVAVHYHRRPWSL